MFQPDKQHKARGYMFYNRTAGYIKFFNLSSASRRVSKRPRLGRIVFPPINNSSNIMGGEGRIIFYSCTFIFYYGAHTPLLFIGHIVNTSILPRYGLIKNERCRKTYMHCPRRSRPMVFLCCLCSWPLPFWLLFDQLDWQEGAKQNSPISQLSNL